MLAAERFERLLADLALTEADRSAGLRAHRAVRASLQAHYYGHLSIQDHSRLIGSWSKGTEVRPPRSIDLLFVLPKALRDRPPLGRDSEPLRLLADVAQVLTVAHGSADVRADAQAVRVSIEGVLVDVHAAFAQQGGRVLVCDGSREGRFRVMDPSAEEAHIRQSDSRTRGNTRDLIRMLKCWQAYREVPLSSFAIELLAIDFLAGWSRAGDQASFYDWMVRDALAFLLTQADATLAIPGAADGLPLGSAWVGRARTAQMHAAKACEFETIDLNADAWWEWEKIFGERIPFESD